MIRHHHWLILKTVMHQDTVAFPTGTRVGGDSQLTEGLAKGSYFGYLEIRGIPRDIYVIVRLFVTCFVYSQPDTYVIN